MKFMTMTPEQRDFLVVGCWAVGSQDNGFLPELNEHAYWIRRDPDDVRSLLDFLLNEGWLEYWSPEDYEKIQSEQEEIIYQNQRERAEESWGR